MSHVSSEAHSDKLTKWTAALWHQHTVLLMACVLEAARERSKVAPEGVERESLEDLRYHLNQFGYLLLHGVSLETLNAPRRAVASSLSYILWL